MKMSKKKMYVVYDSKSESYGLPMFFQSKGVAIRNFTDEVSRPDSLIAKHPEDFTLFELGDYSESTGVFVIHPVKVSVGLACEFKKEV
jgi:hypothetical protein